MSDEKSEAEPRKKKGKVGKILAMGLGLLVLVGGGIGAGVYVGTSGMVGGAHAAEPGKSEPKLVPKEQQERAKIEGAAGGGTPAPSAEGGDKFASSYYLMEKEFTSNLADSVHFIQVGLAVSTPYDKTVLENLKTHEIAVRSAVLMELGATPEDQVFTPQGKEQLQRRLAKAMNDTLKQKEGFGGIGNVYFTNFVVQ